MNMRIDILNILWVCGVNIASDVQVISVLLFNLVIGNEASILGIGSNLLVKSRDDPVNITLAQTVLVAVLYVSTAGINHKDALSVCSTLFVNHENTSSNAGAVEQVCREADDTLDPVLLDNCLSDGGLGISSEQNTMRKDNGSFTVCLQCLKNMHEPSIVAILLRRCISVTLETAILFTSNTIAPVLHGEWRICDDVIKTLKNRIVIPVEILRIRECITALDYNLRLTMKNCVHLRKTGCCALFFLTKSHDRNRCRIDSPN